MPTSILVPQLNANEDQLMVAAVHVEEGDEVVAGTLLFSLESTKASTDIEAPVAGFVRGLNLPDDDRVDVGAALCFLTDTPDEALPEPVKKAEDDIRATAKARALAAAHGIDLAALNVDGLIKERDVRAAIRTPVAIHTGRREKAVVYGMGGHARVMIDLVRQAHPGWELVGVVDDAKELPKDVLGVPVLGGSAELKRLREEGVEIGILGVGAVTRNALRIELNQKLEDHGFRVPTLLHPRAMIEPSVFMGTGNQVFAGAVVGSNVTLADFTIVNSGVVVSHDCIIGSYTHLTPGCILAGNVKVGENSVIGMGVTVYLGVNIGRDVVISNGVHVMADVPDGALVRASS